MPNKGEQEPCKVCDAKGVAHYHDNMGHAAVPPVVHKMKASIKLPLMGVRKR